jgi:hypothetical protein
LSLPLVVIHKVAEAGGINNGKPETDTIFFNIYAREKKMSKKFGVGKVHSPAPMLSIDTVLGRSAEGGSGSLGGYREVLKRVFISVDFPSPDSPAEKEISYVYIVQKKMATNQQPWQ